MGRKRWGVVNRTYALAYEESLAIRDLRRLAVEREWDEKTSVSAATLLHAKPDTFDRRYLKHCFERLADGGYLTDGRRTLNSIFGRSAGRSFLLTDKILPGVSARRIVRKSA